MFEYKYYIDEVGNHIISLSNKGITRENSINYKSENIKYDSHTGGIKIFSQYLPREGVTESFKLNYLDLKKLPEILEELEQFKLFVKEQENG